MPNANECGSDKRDLKAFQQFFEKYPKYKKNIHAFIYLKPKVTLQSYYIHLFWVLVSGILNVFNSY